MEAALISSADRAPTPARFIAVAASLIPQHFKVEHEHKLTMLSDDAGSEQVRSGGTTISTIIDSGGSEVVSSGGTASANLLDSLLHFGAAARRASNEAPTGHLQTK